MNLNSVKKKLLSIEDIVIYLNKLGLCKGCIVLVHSDISRLARILDIKTLREAPEFIYRAIMQVLGNDGTLIVPTFNFDFCNGIPFDIRNTVSKMGVFTEYVRNLPESKRLFHPIYSFSIVGRLSKELGSLRYKSSYGADSLFAKLVELDGKIMIINLPYNHSMTFFHHVEEMEGCDYRYFKEFKGEVTDYDGNTYEDNFIMFARKLDRGVVTQVEPMGMILEEEGVVSIQKVGNVIFKLMQAKDVYRITAIKMKENPYLLHQIEKD